jgi:hypothetical protein
MAPVHHHSSLGRARQIAEVLTRYGFGSLVEALGLTYLIPFHRNGPDRGQEAQEKEKEPTSHTQPERLSMALAGLGNGRSARARRLAAGTWQSLRGTPRPIALGTPIRASGTWSPLLGSPLVAGGCAAPLPDGQGAGKVLRDGRQRRLP